MSAAVCGLMSAPCLVVRAVIKRAQPVLVFRPMPRFTSPQSFGTYIKHAGYRTTSFLRLYQRGDSLSSSVLHQQQMLFKQPVLLHNSI